MHLQHCWQVQAAGVACPHCSQAGIAWVILLGWTDPPGLPQPPLHESATAVASAARGDYVKKSSLNIGIKKVDLEFDLLGVARG